MQRAVLERPPLSTPVQRAEGLGEEGIRNNSLHARRLGVPIGAFGPAAPLGRVERSGSTRGTEPL